MTTKHFNIGWLESFRFGFKRVVPQSYRRILLLTVGIGIPALLLYIIFGEYPFITGIASDLGGA